MKATYYNEIKAKLKLIPEIKHVGRWKNQVEGDAINATPAAYIEILPLTYDSDTAKQQSAENSQFTVHLILKKYTTEDERDGKIYDLSQKIYNILHNTDKFERLSEGMDVSYDKLEDFQLTYVISHLVDEDAMKSYDEITTPDIDFENLMNAPDGS